MKCKDFFREFESRVPVSVQESYDNCGLQIGNPDNEISGILYSLDVTMQAVDLAVSGNCNLIISHHPFIFGGLRNINLANNTGKIIEKCLKENLVIYSAHTNFDKSPFGVSASLANILELSDVSVLDSVEGKLKKLVTFCPEAQSNALRNALFEAGTGYIGNYDSCSFNVSGFGTFRAGENANPFVGEKGAVHHEPEIRIETVFPVWNQTAVLSALFAFHPYEEVAFDIYNLENSWNGYGLGSVGVLKNPLDPSAFLDKIKSALKIKHLRHGRLLPDRITRVAVCGGAGASLISKAIQSGAQAYVTADLKYHDFQAADGRILLIDAGHFETEIFALSALKSLVSEILPNFAPQIISPESNWVNTV
ncbi:GTP cyclohydrolase 1 type 2 [bioreactor metagenome]|uniref:GTP cyclohydrolase 1 type 2 n=1 Tax=bioreactor metagenome TaxID=1076179 RepID=A0A644XH03_9ZZZZ